MISLLVDLLTCKSANCPFLLHPLVNPVPSHCGGDPTSHVHPGHSSSELGVGGTYWRLGQWAPPQGNEEVEIRECRAGAAMHPLSHTQKREGLEQGKEIKQEGGD